MNKYVFNVYEMTLSNGKIYHVFSKTTMDDLLESWSRDGMFIRLPYCDSTSSIDPNLSIRLNAGVWLNKYHIIKISTYPKKASYSIESLYGDPFNFPSQEKLDKTKPRTGWDTTLYTPENPNFMFVMEKDYVDTKMPKLSK